MSPHGLTRPHLNPGPTEPEQGGPGAPCRHYPSQGLGTAQFLRQLLKPDRQSRQAIRSCAGDIPSPVRAHGRGCHCGGTAEGELLLPLL